MTMATMKMIDDLKHVVALANTAIARLTELKEVEIAGPREHGFLIERTGDSEQLLWWCASPNGLCGSWSATSRDALRFARACDAEEMLRALGFAKARVTEHTWEPA